MSLRITPEMIQAGLVAHRRWSRFADAPLEGKKRKWLTTRELEMCTEEAMVREVITAVLGLGK